MKYGRKLAVGCGRVYAREQPKAGGVVKLNTNENPYPPSPKVVEALRSISRKRAGSIPIPWQRVSGKRARRATDIRGRNGCWRATAWMNC